jgi:mannosyltransferase OCH1-like enzyme
MIPKIIHRSVPRETTPLMDECWQSVLDNTPGWQHMTHYDDDNYSYVGKYLPLCGKGAFRADLIRLEALYKYGGIYLDSDIKLFKEIDSLLNHKVFVALENNEYLMNAVMGAEPNNPEIFKMLKFAITIVQSNKFKKQQFAKNFNAYGPYVVNFYSKNKKDVFHLPSEYFLTYWPDFTKLNENDERYKHIKRLIESGQPYGQHLFVGSWLNH